MKKKPLSDRYLMILWRKAILLANGNRCFFCGNTNVNELECHHLVHRSAYILRWDWRNGIPVCVGKCHRLAHRLEGAMMIANAHKFIYYLRKNENVTLMEYCLKNGITKEEFRRQAAKELKEKIKEYNSLENRGII